jgi:hypothetical protein
MIRVVGYSEVIPYMNVSDWIRPCARGALVFGMLVGYAHAQGTSGGRGKCPLGPSTMRSCIKLKEGATHPSRRAGPV